MTAIRPSRARTAGGGRLLAVRASDDRVTPDARVAPAPETGDETPYCCFDLPVEAGPMTTTDHNDVVRNARLVFDVRKAEGPAAGRPKRTHPALGLQSTAAGR
ncbi:hypothetical protein AB0N31_30170 [Streptomyces sp. NPDC051051]|uniref:hypothetical protein n=1 Tax=Streptomyces sp. NPDC051051 TaxID=3155666 RepID=UPI0034253F9B